MSLAADPVDDRGSAVPERDNRNVLVRHWTAEGGREKGGREKDAGEGRQGENGWEKGQEAGGWGGDRSVGR